MKKILSMNGVILVCLGLISSISSSFIRGAFLPHKNTDSITTIHLHVHLLADGLHSPTAIVFPNNEEIWVTEQTGKIRVIKKGLLTELPLLDLQSKMIRIDKSYDERGLLGITLHPQFKANRKFYVYYSAPSDQKSDHKDVVAEYTLSTGLTTIDPNSGRIILQMEKPDGNHDGGCIQFGPDGYLYVSFGDGGGQGDKHGKFGNGQNLNTLLGKILRIDVNSTSGYSIPRDNPFVGKNEIKPEIWAYGFRNPYRFSFDKATGLLFAGDVGQDQWEEVDIVNKGANYGWRLMEGTHCYNPSDGCDMRGITFPISEYNHQEGISVIGGYVYNGRDIPFLKNKYLFADWTGKIFYLQKSGSIWQRGPVSIDNLPGYIKIIGFGEDPSGELYMLTNFDTGPANKKGNVYRIVNH
jgi:glucose/arabinose dehydrogenase